MEWPYRLVVMLLQKVLVEGELVVRVALMLLALLLLLQEEHVEVIYHAAILLLLLLLRAPSARPDIASCRC